MKVLAAAAMALAMVGLGSAAQADIITWNLNDVVFDDGGTASGFFDYDTVLGTAANFDINTTTGPQLAGFHYTTLNSVFYGADLFAPNSLLWYSQPADRYIVLQFADVLSAPGTVVVVPGQRNASFAAFGSWECDNCLTARDVVAGSVTSGAVPEPAAWTLMLVGFGGLGAMLRRRNAVVAAA